MSTTLLESHVVGHLDEVGDLVLGDPVVVNPSRALPQALVDAVLPDTGRQVNLALPTPRVDDRGNDELLADGELVDHQVAGWIGWVEHPERPDYRQARVQGDVGVFFQKRCHRLLAESRQALGYLEHALVRVFTG